MKGDEGVESANDDEISPGGWQALWMIPSSTKRLICAFQHEYWIINGIMFVVGKRRRFCLRFLPLLPAISISLQPSFHEKLLYPLLYFLYRPFAVYTWLSRLTIYNYDGWEQNEYSLCRVNERRWWLYSIHTACCCLLSRWAARFLDSRCRAPLIAWLSDQRRLRLVEGVFDLLEEVLHRVTSFFPSELSRFKPKKPIFSQV